MRLVVGSFLLVLLMANGGGCARSGAVSPPANPPAPPAAALPAGAVELLPRGAPADARLPLVVALHGRGGSPARFGLFVQATASGARIVALRAPDQHEDGYSWFERRLAYDTGDAEDDRALALAIFQRVAELRPIIVRLAESRPHCGDPIIVGYSQGAALTLGLAVTAPPDFKAEYFEIAGALPQSFPFGSNLPYVTGFHGEADALVPYSYALATFLRSTKSADWTLYTYEGAGHDPPRQLRQDLGDELRRAFYRACHSPAPGPAGDPGARSASKR